MNIIPHRALSPEWFAYRRTRVSGSTAAAILGVSNPKWSSPLTEWMRLTGKSSPAGKIEPWHIWGQESEPFNRSLYQQATGRSIEVLDGIVQHDSLEWLCYTPDGLVVSCNADDRIEMPAIYEAKAPAPWKADAWSEAIPLEYQVQAQIGMEVLNMNSASFSALIWPGVKWYDVQRDQRFIDVAVERIQRFLDHNVARDIPPEVRAGEADKAALKLLASEVEVHYAGELKERFEKVTELRAQINQLEDTMELHQNRLVQMTGRPTWMAAKQAIQQSARSTK